MKKKKMKMTMVKLLVALFTGIAAISCSSDEFFGFEEEQTGLNKTTILEIAKSKEYIDFQTISYLFMEDMFKIDTAEMIIIDTLNGRPLYVSKTEKSIRPVLDARKHLVEMYPEYEIANLIEQNEILNNAINYNTSLKKLAYKYNPRSFKRTKSVNPESPTDSQQWLLNSSGITLIDEVTEEWYAYNLFTYTSNNYFNCISTACSYTSNQGVEYGGYGWNSDGSGLLIWDPNATPTHMYFIWSKATPSPSFDFHIHPSGSKVASSTDWDSWSNIGTNIHFIYDCGGGYVTYYN